MEGEDPRVEKPETMISPMPMGCILVSDKGLSGTPPPKKKELIPMGRTKRLRIGIFGDLSGLGQEGAEEGGEEALA